MKNSQICILQRSQCEQYGIPLARRTFGRIEPYMRLFTVIHSSLVLENPYWFTIKRSQWSLIHGTKLSITYIKKFLFKDLSKISIFIYFSSVFISKRYLMLKRLQQPTKILKISRWFIYRNMGTKITNKRTIFFLDKYLQLPSLSKVFQSMVIFNIFSNTFPLIAILKLIHICKRVANLLEKVRSEHFLTCSVCFWCCQILFILLFFF